MHKALYSLFSQTDKIVYIDKTFEYDKNSLGMKQKYNPKEIANEIRQRVHELIEDKIDNIKFNDVKYNSIEEIYNKAIRLALSEYKSPLDQKSNIFQDVINVLIPTSLDSESIKNRNAIYEFFITYDYSFIASDGNKEIIDISKNKVPKQIMKQIKEKLSAAYKIKTSTLRTIKYDKNKDNTYKTIATLYQISKSIGLNFSMRDLVSYYNRKKDRK